MALTVSIGPPRASLTGIPPELRMRIYHFIFQSSQIRFHLDVLNQRGERYHEDDECECLISECYHWPSAYHAQIDSSRFEHGLTESCRLIREESLVLSHVLTKLHLCSKSFGPSSCDPSWTPVPLPLRLLRRIGTIFVDWDLVRLLPLENFKGGQLLTATNVNVYLDRVHGKDLVMDESTADSRLVEILETNLEEVASVIEPDLRTLYPPDRTMRFLYSVKFPDMLDPSEVILVSIDEKWSCTAR